MIGLIITSILGYVWAGLGTTSTTRGNGGEAVRPFQPIISPTPIIKEPIKTPKDLDKYLPVTEPVIKPPTKQGEVIQKVFPTPPLPPMIDPRDFIDSGNPSVQPPIGTDKPDVGNVITAPGEGYSYMIDPVTGEEKRSNWKDILGKPGTRTKGDTWLIGGKIVNRPPTVEEIWSGEASGSGYEGEYESGQREYVVEEPPGDEYYWYY